MPDTVTLRLIIDGKEAIATLDVVKGEFIATGNAADQASEVIQKSYKQLNEEAIKYSEVNEGNVASLQQFITTQNISMDMIEKTIGILENEAKTLSVNSDAWKQKMATAANLKLAYGQLINQQTNYSSSTQSSMPGIQNMNMAMGQLGYTIGDASMFMVNARMGMMSIANNIPMIVSGFIDAKKAAGEHATTMQLLTKSIMGGGGLLLGINALMLVMQILPGLFSGTTAEAERQSDAIKALKKDYEDLTSEALDNEIAKKEIELSKFTQKMQRKAGSVDVFDQISDEDVKEYDKKVKELNAIREVKRDLGNIENIENRIAANRKQLNKLNEEEGSPFYWKNIVKTAKSYSEAKATLEQWIDADEKRTRKSSSSEVKKFAEEKARAINDLVKKEFEQQEADRLANLNYMDLLEQRNKKEQELSNLHSKIREAKSSTELASYLVQADLTEKSLKLIDDRIKKEEELNETLVENYRKEREERNKVVISEQDFLKEKEKFMYEFDSKFESNPVQKQLKELDAEEAVNMQRLELYGATEEQKKNLHAFYAKQREKIESLVWQNNLRAASQGLSGVAALFNEHTVAYKTLKAAQAIIDTYSAADVALAAYPPPFNYIAMAGVIATGMKNVQNILSVSDVKMPGYAKGGAIVGERGVEIIAPAQDYATGMAELVNRTVMEVQNHFISSSGGNNGSLVSEIRDLKKVIIENPFISIWDPHSANQAMKEFNYKNRKRKF